MNKEKAKKIKGLLKQLRFAIFNDNKLIAKEILRELENTIDSENIIKAENGYIVSTNIVRDFNLDCTIRKGLKKKRKSQILLGRNGINKYKKKNSQIYRKKIVERLLETCKSNLLIENTNETLDNKTCQLKQHYVTGYK